MYVRMWCVIKIPRVKTLRDDENIKSERDKRKEIRPPPYRT